MCTYTGETEYTAEFADESGARGALMLNGTKLGGKPLSVAPQDRPVRELARTHSLFLLKLCGTQEKILDRPLRGCEEQF